MSGSRMMHRLIAMIRPRPKVILFTVAPGTPLPEDGNGIRYVYAGSWPNPMRPLSPDEAESIIKNTNVKIFPRDPGISAASANGTAS